VLAAISKMIFKSDSSFETMYGVGANAGSALMLGSRFDKSRHVFNLNIMTVFVIFQQQQIDVFWAGFMFG
jgi:hypothetical protein